MIRLICYVISGECIWVSFWGEKRALILLVDVWWGPDIQRKEFYKFGLISFVIWGEAIIC